MYVFVSGKDPQEFAVPADPSAARLPRDHEPWTFTRFEPIRSRVDYVDLAEAEAAIKAEGFNLCRDLSL